MTERWLPVVDFEGYYEVSSLGRVRSLPRAGIRHSECVVRLGHHKLGYKLISLSGGGRRTTRLVHRVVMEAFVGPRPKGHVICHGNGDPADNRLENLRHDTQSSNLLDAVRQGTHPLAASTHCKRGHEFTPENTALDSSGWRHCRECSRVRQRKGGIPAPQLHALKTHCPQGHPYDEANTFIKPSDGGRECRVCRLAHQRARRERLRAAGLPVT